MNKVYFLLGSNLSNRFSLLNQARMLISEKIGTIGLASGIYESAPWGFKAETAFLNQTILVETHLEPLNILEVINKIENQLGRIRRSASYESRTIDIDILFYNDENINLPHLVIPHNQLHNRKFTLVPLIEIAANFVHPIFNKSIEELLRDCEDQSEVKLISE